MIKRLLILISLCLFLSNSVQAQGIIYLPMVVKMFRPQNSYRFILPREQKNYAKNPSAEGEDFFAAVGGATVNRVTDVHKYGIRAYEVTTTGNGDGLELDLDTLSSTSFYVTARLILNDPPDKINFVLNGNSIEARQIEKVDSRPNGFGIWYLYGAAFPAALAAGATTLEINQGGSGAHLFYADGVQVEEEEYTTYIDGTQPGCIWLGVPHGSASLRSDLSRAGGRVVDFYQEYGFSIEKVIGLGAATTEINIDSYALLPGGEFNSEKTNPRDFTIIGKFFADTEEDLDENWNKLKIDLANRTYPGNQPILIRYLGGKVQKEIGAYYKGGLEGDAPAYYNDDNSSFERDDDKWIEVKRFTAKAAIQFQAPDPAMYEVGESAAVLETTDSATFSRVAARTILGADFTTLTTWNNLGNPAGSGNVLTIAEDDTYVYWGGSFTNFDGIANADRIVKYNKQTGDWEALSTGANDTVQAILPLPNGHVIVAGAFTTIGGVAASRIADYDPATDTFSAMGAGTDNTVNALAYYNGIIYLGGLFLNAGGGAANRVAAYNINTATYSALAGGVDNSVFTLTIWNGILYIGGGFANADGSPAAFIVAWDPVNLSFIYLTNDLDGQVNALAVYRNSLAIGGGFSNPFSYITLWNGSAYFDLNGGVNADVRDLSIGPDGMLIAVGDFDTAGQIALPEAVARYNGYAWAHLDIDLPTTYLVSSVLASKYVDPVAPSRYNLYLGSSTAGTGVFCGAISVGNGGSVPAYPKVVFQRQGGDGATIQTLRNERLGTELLLDYSLSDGESLTIELNPKKKTVVSSFFGPVPGAVLANSDLGNFALSPGYNAISSFVSEDGSPTMLAYMLWRDAFN